MREIVDEIMRILVDIYLDYFNWIRFLFYAWISVLNEQIERNFIIKIRLYMCYLVQFKLSENELISLGFEIGFES